MGGEASNFFNITIRKTSSNIMFCITDPIYLPFLSIIALGHKYQEERY